MPTLNLIPATNSFHKPFTLVSKLQELIQSFETVYGYRPDRIFISRFYRIALIKEINKFQHYPIARTSAYKFSLDNIPIFFAKENEDTGNIFKLEHSGNKSSTIIF